MRNCPAPLFVWRYEQNHELYQSSWSWDSDHDFPKGSVRITEKITYSVYILMRSLDEVLNYEHLRPKSELYNSYRNN
jgi:hypothetical protein